MYSSLKIGHKHLKKSLFGRITFFAILMLLVIFSITLSLLSSPVNMKLALNDPNIVMIVADDLGFNDISWHNQAVRSPNLEKLAKEGVILNHHYSQPICTPTRAALMTGR